MDLGQSDQMFRLVPRGGPGLACDAEGVTLGGVALAAVRLDARGRAQTEVRSGEEIRRILNLAYGAQSEASVQRCERGLRRVVGWLEAGDLALAGIEAVMLRFPTVDADRLAKLARLADLEKGGSSWEDEPRRPAGRPGAGEWTTAGGDDGGERTSPGAPRRAGDEGRGTSEATVASRVHQSRTENASGFYPNSAGGGVLYIPSLSDGRPIRSTEVHVVDASALRVGWGNDAITLKDRAGHLYAVAASDLAHFNATTGKILGVSIYTYPETPLAAPDGPPTAAEQRQFAQERADLEAGERISEQSWSGRLVAGAGGVLTALPLLALLPEGAGAAPELWLNTGEANETGIALARRLGLEGEQAVGINGPKVGIRIPGNNQLRVPDAVSHATKTLTEVKNVARLRLTPQLHDFLNFCRANGYQFVLYVRRETELSPELGEMIERGEIERRIIPRSR